MRTLRRLLAPVLFIAALSGGGANWDALGSRVSASHSVPLTVTITRVQAIVDEADEGLEALGESTADLYAEVLIDGTKFSSFDVHEDDNPLVEPFWVFSKIVPGEGARVISIRILDHDSTSEDDIGDADPGLGVDVDLTIDMATGRWTGDVNWPKNCSEGTGSTAVRTCWDVSVLSGGGDADSDGLLDGWETNGYDADGDGTIDLPLNTWGANPRHKDLFLEFDWMTGQAPTRAAIQAVKAAFAAAPATAGGAMNPDGLPGINLWIDTGNLTDPTAQEDGAAANSCGDGMDNGADGTADANDPDCLVGDNLGGGNAIPGFFACLDSNFFNAKAAVTNFNPLRRWVFRYGMSGQGDGIPMGGCNGGQGEIGGNDFIEHNHDGGTIMHELGHNLNLRHGGNEDSNCKPNYISVMDYDEQFGINQAGGGTIFDYSPPLFAGGRGAAPLATIFENDLDETVVLDASDATNRVVFTDANGNKVQSAVNGPLDFDGDGAPTDTAVTVNVDTNATGGGPPAACANGVSSATLRGFDDWSNIALGFRQFGDSASGAINPTDQEPTTEELLALRDALNRTDTAVTIASSPDPVAAGEVLTYTVTVANHGPNPASRPRVVAVLPAGMTVLDNTGGCLENPVQTLTCDLAEIVARTNRVFTIRVRVAADLVYNNGAPLTISASANVTNTAGSQEIDGGNNAASASTRVVAVADLAIVSFAPFDPPSEVLVGVPVTITMRKTVTSRGPSAPMDVKLARTASSPPDAVISPASSTEVASAVTLHEHRVVDELFTITCNGYSNHTFTFTNTISPNRPDDIDPDLSNNSATATLTFECVVPVAINNKPASDPNSISLRGETPVAVLTTTAGEYGLPLDFDATRIDPLSVRFGQENQLWEGSGGAPEAHARGHAEDGYELDERTRDGDQDMVLHFRNAVSGLTPASTRACVKGRWHDAGGNPHTFFGCDAVVVRP